jgi:hypothetical protein
MGLKILNLKVGRKEGGFRMDMKSSLKVGFATARLERGSLGLGDWRLYWNGCSPAIIRKLSN